MNPQSAYYLSFNTGYPNAFDKALGRTGSQLMVHGDCSSRGCYAMTDEQIAEIYSLGRESFFGGQKAFQLQAYPFRMTPVNMAKHRNNPNMPFWKMIKEGYDHFEVTRQEPKVDFCEKKYVFDAAKAPNAKRDPVFDASAKCPAYVIPDEIADAVRERQQQEAAETAKLIAKGTPVARLNTGIDGGMNKVFAAKLPEGNTGLSEGGDSQSLATLALARAPGTIPSTVNPPKPNLAQPEEPVVAVAHPPRRRTAPAADPRRFGGTGDAAIRRLLLQPRPQGRHRPQRRRDARERAAAARRRKAEDRGRQAAASRWSALRRSPKPSPKPSRRTPGRPQPSRR